MDFKNAIKAISEIKEKHGKPESDVIDVMTCPECGGNLQYAVSSHNGHTQGCCDTDDCVRWIE